MSQQALLKRNLHAAQDQLSPFHEAVRVITRAEARKARECELPVRASGELLVCGLAFGEDKRWLVARHDVQRAVVRDCAEIARVVCLFDAVKAKRLRRLHAD